MNPALSVLHLIIRIVLIAGGIVALFRSELSPAMKGFVFFTCALLFYILLSAMSVMADFLRLHVVMATYLRELHRAVIGFPHSRDNDRFTLGAPVSEREYSDPALTVPQLGPDDPAFTAWVFLVAASAVVAMAVIFWSWWPEISYGLSRIH